MKFGCLAFNNGNALMKSYDLPSKYGAGCITVPILLCIIKGKSVNSILF